MSEQKPEIAARTRLLDDANKVILGDRAHDYGDARESFQRIADLWTAILPVRNDVTAEQVAQCMIAMKLSRLVQTPGHRDSWLDIAGYAALGHEIAEGPVLS